MKTNIGNITEHLMLKNLKFSTLTKVDELRAMNMFIV